MKILVAGSTGNTGARLVEELCERGHDPVALVRASSDTGVLPDQAEQRQGDLTDLSGDVARDCDVVVFAAGSGGDTSAEMTDKVDRDGAIRLIDIAKEVMESAALPAVKFDVPLIVDAGKGASWAEAH